MPTLSGTASESLHTQHMSRNHLDVDLSDALLRRASSSDKADRRVLARLIPTTRSAGLMRATDSGGLSNIPSRASASFKDLATFSISAFHCTSRSFSMDPCRSAWRVSVGCSQTGGGAELCTYGELLV